MTLDIDLAAAIGCSEALAAVWKPHLDRAMAAYGIDTPARQAAFLAQIAHESGRLRYVRELWGPTEAQQRYEGRADLGNINRGDGFRFRGRGLIQITGRANYIRASIALFGYPSKLLTTPELLEEPEHAARSAAWYWHEAGCNQLADEGRFKAITRRINGGLNGYADRLALHQSISEAMA